MERKLEQACIKVECKQCYKKHDVYIFYYLNDDGSLGAAHFNGCSVYEAGSLSCTQCRIEATDRFKADFERDRTARSEVLRVSSPHNKS